MLVRCTFIQISLFAKGWSERLGWLGIRMDEQRNQAANGQGAYAIHAPDSAVEVWVVPTDEGRIAAKEAAALLAGPPQTAAAPMPQSLAPQGL